MNGEIAELDRAVIACLQCQTPKTVDRIARAVFLSLATGEPRKPLAPLAAEKVANTCAARLRAPSRPNEPIPFPALFAVLSRPMRDRIARAVFNALFAGGYPLLADPAEHALALAACARLRWNAGEEWAAFVMFCQAVESVEPPMPPTMRLDRLAPPPTMEPTAPDAKQAERPAFCALPEWQREARADWQKARRAHAAANRAVDRADYEMALDMALADERETRAKENAALSRVCHLRPAPPQAPAEPPAKRKGRK